MKIRALIVDDEALARGRLRKLLAEAADLEIIGESSNGPEAISFIRERRPDLAFLDVQMPEVSGFDVLRALPEEIWPAVVFVTAHNQHAIEAFEVQPGCWPQSSGRASTSRRAIWRPAISNWPNGSDPPKPSRRT